MIEVLSGSARWAVVHGRWQDFADQLPGRCVDHVLTDPPYSEHTHAKARARARKAPLRDGNGHLTRCAIAREVEFGFDAITQDEREAAGDIIERVCRRWSLVFSDVESTGLWRGAMTSAGLEYIRTLAYVRIGATPQFTGDRPGTAFEAVTVCHPKGRKRWNGGGKGNVYQALSVIGRGGQRQGNNSRCHPTQKPLDLMLDLVRDFTDPGDLVLDLYAGSGTTGVACLRLGRRFLGFEMQQAHVETARARLAAEDAGSTLAAARAGQLPMFGGA